MKMYTTSSGFALFVAVLLVAITSLISLAMVNVYLSNTRATGIELQRVKADQLLESGVRFAALSLASPRAKVSGSATPSARLVYAAPSANIMIEIENEAGFIDLLSADRELLKSVMIANGVLHSEVRLLIKSIQSMAESKGGPSYRKLRQILADNGVEPQQLLSLTSLHNGQAGVHPSMASESVLALIPRLSLAERSRLLSKRQDKSPSLISNPINNQHFTSTVSAHYRISTSVVVEGQTYSRVQIIKMVNQKGQLYELQATL